MATAERKAAYEVLMKFYPFSVENLDGEEWKDIRGYGGDYQISNFGRVKSFKQGKVIILKPNFSNGYLRIKLLKSGERMYFSVHRLVAKAFIPNHSNKPEVNHIDGQKLNNYVGNLEWCTSSENRVHSYRLELNKSGGEHYLAKMTNEQAIYIRNNPDNLAIGDLAKKFNVNKTTISFIQIGKSYKNAGGESREKIDTRIPNSVRKEIRKLYKKGVRGCGCKCLARKFGCDSKTILKIVKEVD